MNWKDEAIKDLKNFENRKSGCLNLADRVRTLKELTYSAKTNVTNKIPVSGGGSHIENFNLNNIVEMERLKATYIAAKRLVTYTERGLSHISDEERMVLDKFFINKTGNCVKDLCEMLGYEKTKVYAIREEALYKFTVAMYGLVDY